MLQATKQLFEVDKTPELIYDLFTFKDTSYPAMWNKVIQPDKIQLFRDCINLVKTKKASDHKHHIIPRCVAKFTNVSKFEIETSENLVDVSILDHIRLHKLLAFSARPELQTHTGMKFNTLMKFTYLTMLLEYDLPSNTEWVKMFKNERSNLETMLYDPRYKTFCDMNELDINTLKKTFDKICQEI